MHASIALKQLKQITHACTLHTFMFTAIYVHTCILADHQSYPAIQIYIE